MSTEKANCQYCKRDDSITPLVSLQYHGKPLWICPQHLPILIHDPTKLENKLPGAENLQSAEGHHH